MYNHLTVYKQMTDDRINFKRFMKYLKSFNCVQNKSSGLY